MTSDHKVARFLLSLGCLCIVSGCGAPGEPQPKRPPVPVAVKDLAARQSGEGVVLTFALPKNSTEGQLLPEPPSVEIYRGTLPPGAGPGKLSTRLVYTIPSALVDTYLTEGRVRFVDPLRPEDLAANAGGQMVYMVRTRASKPRASADSNAAAVRVFPVPAPITDLRAVVTEFAVELVWSPPSSVPNSASLAGYRVYRGEAPPAASGASKETRPSSLPLLAPASSSSYRDTSFEFGKTYVYAVSSVAQFESDSVESRLSPLVEITPRDIFPPAAPKDLVAILIPAMPGAPAHVELSWAISQETDLAGYHVYRSEEAAAEPSGRGERLTRELLLGPTFRDMSVALGRRYRYRVTAVDRAGNESPLSETATVETPPATTGTP